MKEVLFVTDDQIIREMREEQRDVLDSRGYSSMLYYSRKEYMDVKLDLLREFLLTKKFKVVNQL